MLQISNLLFGCGNKVALPASYRLIESPKEFVVARKGKKTFLVSINPLRLFPIISRKPAAVRIDMKHPVIIETKQEEANAQS
ncbi:MAG: hypothetical protein ABSA97_07350 [Verrucomicrobiia bacterium]